jgi:membrane protease YdiL (CAAX protease family)
LEQLTEGPLWVAFLSVSVFAPLFEEWLCRGLVLRGLLRKFNPASAIMVSAAFFAILHMNPWQAIPAFLLGLLFGYVYYKTGSLKLTMLMHCVNNTLALITSRIPSLTDAETFMDIMSPWAYVCIYIASGLFVAAAIITFKGIPQNRDEQPSI